MIGAKTAGAVGLAAVAIGVAAARGRLAMDHVSTLGATSCFAIGLFAGLAAALVGVGWRPKLPSRLAIGWRDRRVVLEATADARDVPAAVQRALLIAAFACVGLGVFTNPGTARLVALPASVGEPSPGEYCRPEPVADPAAAVAPAPASPVEIPGCALVKRAFQLGYAKTLGNCAPKEAPPAVKAAIAARAPCPLRQRDEPYLHFAWRRLSGAGGAIAGSRPIATVEHGVAETRTQLDHLDSLVAAQRHAVTGSPHASHHLWISLPDPHPGSLIGDLIAPPRCDARYADLPVWPAPGVSAGQLVDHVLGQLLFAARFGTTASCRDYSIHWGAAPTACAELIANPVGFLDRADALAAVRDVLDRRRRKVELRALDIELGRKTPAAPPEARVIVSFACFAIDPSVTAPVISGRDVTIDGEPVSVREIRVPAVTTTGTGTIDVYTELAGLLAGEDRAGPEPTAAPPEPAAAPDDLSHDDYLLVRLDRLHDADPFLGLRWPLDWPDVVEVYPFHRHLRGFVDGFRRRYRAQRGRL